MFQKIINFIVMVNSLIMVWALLQVFVFTKKTDVLKDFELNWERVPNERAVRSKAKKES